MSHKYLMNIIDWHVELHPSVCKEHNRRSQLIFEINKILRGRRQTRVRPKHVTTKIELMSILSPVELKYFDFSPVPLSDNKPDFCYEFKGLTFSGNRYSGEDFFSFLEIFLNWSEQFDLTDNQSFFLFKSALRGIALTSRL